MLCFSRGEGVRRLKLLDTGKRIRWKMSMQYNIRNRRTYAHESSGDHALLTNHDHIIKPADGRWHPVDPQVGAKRWEERRCHSRNKSFFLYKFKWLELGAAGSVGEKNWFPNVFDPQKVERLFLWYIEIKVNHFYPKFKDVPQTCLSTPESFHR